MSLALNPYWQTFSAPWRQRKTEKAFGFLIALAVLMVVGWLVLLISTQFDSKAIGAGVGMTLVFTSHVFLVLYVTSAMAYNRPACVLTVPGYLRVQRRTLMATWGVAVLVQWLGLILLRELGFARISENNGLLLVICVACSLFAPLAVRFRRWFSIPMMFSGFWLPRLAAFWPQALTEAWLWPVWSEFDWVIAPTILGSMAWAVSVWALRPGDAKHRAIAQSRNGLLAAMGGNFGLVEGKQARSPLESLSKLGGGAGFRVNKWTFNRRMAASQPTPDSVLDRAELGFAIGADWSSQLVVAVFAGIVGALMFWVLSPDSIDSSRASATLLFLAAVVGWFPTLHWYHSVKRTQREQGLLMLVPGMPSGNDLARRLAWRVVQTAAVSWAVIALALAIFFHLWPPSLPLFTWLAWGLVLASMQGLPFLVCDWAQVRPQAGPSKLLLLGLPLLAGAVALAVAMAWSAWPMALWVVLALAATLAHLAWRWRRLATMGQPLPVGRSLT